MGLAAAFEIERTEERYEEMLDALTPDEHGRLEADVKELTNRGVVDVRALRRLQTSYLMTHEICRHPAFKAQRGKYLAMLHSGELFEGLDATPIV